MAIRCAIGHQLLDLQPELIQTNKTLAAINTNIEKLVKVSKSALKFLVNSQRVTAVSGGNHQPSLLRDTQQISAGNPPESAVDGIGIQMF